MSCELLRTGAARSREVPEMRESRSTDGGQIRGCGTVQVSAAPPRPDPSRAPAKEADRHSRHQHDQAEPPSSDAEAYSARVMRAAMPSSTVSRPKANSSGAKSVSPSREPDPSAP